MKLGLERLRGLLPTRKADVPSDGVNTPPPRPPLPRLDPRLEDRLSAVEQAALVVYRKHGLPVQAGDYRRGPRGGHWIFIGDDLSPEERWASITDYPPENGWHHARLEDIGGYETRPPLIAASRLLVRCRWLRGRLYGVLPGDPVQDLLAAIDLGAAWRTLAPDRSPVRAAAGTLSRSPTEFPATEPAHHDPISDS